jgi:hypothetical protein
MSDRQKDSPQSKGAEEILTLVHLLEYIRADVAQVSHPAGLAIDLAVALLTEQAGRSVSGTDGI